MIRGKKSAQALWTVAAILPILLAAFLLLPPEAIRTEAEAAPILIIDAGHGGEDGGAVAPDGVLESDLNLDIALRLEALARFWGVQTRLTREGSELDYPDSAQTLAAKKKADQNARIALINDTPGSVLISIHQNNYPAQAPNGIQVFYGPEPESDGLAAVMQDNLTAQLCRDNRRISEPIDEEIYLMRMVRCPAVLVECGFLSNPSELDKLETEEYRMELASVMLASYLQYIRGTTI